MVGEILGLDGVVWLVIIVVVLFGGAAIPKLARGLGTAKHEFEKGLKESAQSNGSTPSATDTAAKATDESGTAGS